MKEKLFVATVLLFSIGFASKATCQLSEQQREQIKAEIETVCDSIVAKAERLDTTYVQFYLNSPDWMCINPDGSRSDFQTFKESLPGYADSITAFKWSTDLLSFPFVTEKFVVCTIIGHSEASLESGDKLIWSPDAYTYIFRKVESKWKVFYSQESTTFTRHKLKRNRVFRI